MKWLIDIIKKMRGASVAEDIGEMRMNQALSGDIALMELNARKDPNWESYKEYIEHEFAEHIVAALNAMTGELRDKDGAYQLAIYHLRLANYYYNTMLKQGVPEIVYEERMKTIKKSKYKPPDHTYADGSHSSDALESASRQGDSISLDDLTPDASGIARR